MDRETLLPWGDQARRLARQLRPAKLTWFTVLLPSVLLLAGFVVYRVMSSGLAHSLKVSMSEGAFILFILMAVFVGVAFGIARQTMEGDPGPPAFRRARRVKLRLKNRRRFRVSAREQRLARLRALDLSGVDLMSGAEFEKYLLVLLEHRGFRARHVGGAGDQGVDIVAEKDSVRTAVQAKRYSEPLNNKAIQEVVTGKAVHKCAEAMVVTTSTFNSGAREAAIANNCLLVDRKMLAEWILEFREVASQSWRSMTGEEASAAATKPES